MSDDPWTVLGISREGSTEREVKLAYTKLLRVHRPDKDPEGFKRLRAAYEAATVLIKGKEPPAGVEIPSLSLAPELEEVPLSRRETQLPPAPPALPPAVQEAMEALRGSIASRIRQKIREAWSRLDQVAAEFSQQQRRDLAMECFAGDTQLVSEVCSDERLLAQLEAGDTRLVLRVLSAWEQQPGAKRLQEFIVSLNRTRKLHGSEACALVMVHAAIALACWDTETASRLASKAFPALAGEVRTLLMKRADEALGLGRIVAPLPLDQRMFWLSCLQGKPPSRSWNDADARKLLHNLLVLCGTRWPGFAVLQSVLPPNDWTALVNALNSLLR